jgi:hypothetical protein|tara:strand:+ start:2135 stop:2539 length:405 start_codon:yes stop_codon:yes gene_type:complete
MLVSTGAIGESSSLNLAIPQSQQSYQSDRIRAGNIECSNAIGSATNVEFGVVGIIGENDPYGYNNNSGASMNTGSNNGMVKDVGVYAKITIPIGGPKERINCNTLYQLELEKTRLEVRKLKAEIQSMKQLEFDN